MSGAVLLAAGASSRMGTPKGLLRADGVTVLERMVGVLQALKVDPVCVVVGAETEGYLAQVPAKGFRYVENPRWEHGRTSSVKAGLQDVRRSGGGTLVWPVDHPFVSPQTLSRLLERGRVSQFSWVVPVYHGRRGHPPLLMASAIESVLEYGDDEPLNRYPREFPSEVAEVLVEDNAILQNLDTPEAYATALRNLPGGGG